ncbi:MAG: MarR family transcriptional regulator, partial [Candidatus Micrarchaeota archaeon]|nr:MarR family transcriptional regulator [Candidatus Micrarchaeota archaeon]
MLDLSGGELTALKVLSNTSGLTMAELAQRMGGSASVATRAVQHLEQRQFVTTVRTRQKRVSLSTSAHALAFQALLNLHPHVDFASTLSHSSLRVLSAFTGRACTIGKMAQRSRTPQVSVRRVVSRLMEQGILVRQMGREYQVALSGLENFVQAYCRFALGEKCGSAGFIHVGPNAVVRTSNPVPPLLAPTGLSVLNEYGVDLIQADAHDYYVNLFDESGKKVTFEQALVHALLRATLISSGRESAYALLAMNKNWNRFDRASFFEEADDFNVLNVANEAVGRIERFQRKAPWLEPLTISMPMAGTLWPSLDEFQELVD